MTNKLECPSYDKPFCAGQPCFLCDEEVIVEKQKCVPSGSLAGSIADGSSVERDYYAWLIETEKEGVILYRDLDPITLPTWTKDSCEAMQFSRRIDAEKFADGDEEDIRIVEHFFERGIPYLILKQ